MQKIHYHARYCLTIFCLSCTLYVPYEIWLEDMYGKQYQADQDSS